MPFDYKKEYREFYLPPKKPHLITIPRMNFVAVHGKGDPNAPGGAYQEAMGVLYGIAFTIKMSYKDSHKMDGYFEYSIVLVAKRIGDTVPVVMRTYAHLYPNKQQELVSRLETLSTSSSSNDDSDLMSLG